MPEKIFGGHLSHMETQLHAKIEKKYRTVKAVGPERTYERTYVRTHKSEFIGSFRSLKTSGEPIMVCLLNRASELIYVVCCG